MSKLSTLILALAAATALSACDTDAERAVAGAAAGALIVDAFDGDPLLGAAAGAAAGAFCDDVGACPN